VLNSWEALDAAFKAANVDHPSPGALARLRTLLKQHPNAWRSVGDLGYLARFTMLQQFQAPPALQTSTEAALYWLRCELQREGDGAVEQLAIEAILTAWLDYQLTMARWSKYEGQGLSIRQVEHWQKRLTRTQGRYLRALETLARIRKLGVSIQVNIAAAGGQQINVAAGSEGEATRRSG
jgi:hypothetical protein